MSKLFTDYFMFDLKINKDAPKAMSDEELIKKLTDDDPDRTNNAMGGINRTSYAVGTGVKLVGFLARRGKDLKEEIRSIKPTVADVVKAKVNMETPKAWPMVGVTDDVFQQPQGRRGFMRTQSAQPQRQRNNSRRETITGAGDSVDFSAPIDLFNGNISDNITVENIKDYMAEHKDLVLLECVDSGDTMRD